MECFDVSSLLRRLHKDDSYKVENPEVPPSLPRSTPSKDRSALDADRSEHAAQDHLCDKNLNSGRAKS